MLPTTGLAGALLAEFAADLRHAHASKDDPDGSIWCRKHGIGPFRERWGEPMPEVVLLKPFAPISVQRTNEDAQILRSYCRLCGLCEWARRTE